MSRSSDGTGSGSSIRVAVSMVSSMSAGDGISDPRMAIMCTSHMAVCNVLGCMLHVSISSMVLALHITVVVLRHTLMRFQRHSLTSAEDASDRSELVN